MDQARPGSTRPAHAISVAAWLVSLGAAVVFVVALAVWIVSRLRRGV